jgi:N-acetylglucosamine kinase-like BadF-type ATPase
MTSDEVNSELRSRIQHRLQQLHEAVPQGLAQVAPTLLPRLQECLNAGNAVEAERILNHAVALINSSRNCLSCHN